MTRTEMNVAASMAVGALVMVAGVAGYFLWADQHNPPPQVAATAPPEPPLRRGPVIAKPENAVPTKDGTKVAAAAPAPAPLELPPKVKDGVRMYANINWVGDTRLQLQFLGPHLGVIPGKGYCKLMPLVVPDRARPFVNTTGRWISTDPPVYELWHRVAGAKLPDDFRAVYVRGGTWWFVDLDRSYADGEQIVVERPGEVGRPYIKARAELPPKPAKK